MKWKLALKPQKANIKKRFELVKSVVEQEWTRVLFSDEGKLELFGKSRVPAISYDKYL